MKIRIKFEKTGALVYIGHLDVMRYFQKLFRRAQIPVKYSEGFSPHQILSFSHPLPLGMESEGEYADVELTDSITSDEAIRRLDIESVPEIKIKSFKELPERAENAMASVKAARYRVSFINSNPFADKLSDVVKRTLSSKELSVVKVTKKSEKIVDIRPFIYELEAISDNTIEMLISSGSTDNVKPELLINAIASMYGLESIDETELKMKRIDQYTLKNDKLISLDEVGSRING